MRSIRILVFLARVCSPRPAGRALGADWCGADHRPGDRCPGSRRARRDGDGDQHRDRRRPSRRCRASAGVYTLAGLPPGVYAIDVMLAGFRPVRREERARRDRADDSSRLRADDRQRVRDGDRDRRRHRRFARRPAWARSSRRRRSSRCRSTAAASSRWRRSCRASRCRQGSQFPRINGGRPAHQRVPVRRHLRAAAGARPGGVLSRSSTRSRSSRSRRTARPRNSAASTAASST